MTACGPLCALIAGGAESLPLPAVPSRIWGSFTALIGDERKSRIKDRRQDRRSAQSHLPAVRAVPSVSQVVGIGVKSRKKK